MKFLSFGALSKSYFQTKPNDLLTNEVDTLSSFLHQFSKVALYYRAQVLCGGDHVFYEVKGSL